MDAWLKRLRKDGRVDRIARSVLIGGTILLFLIVLIDAFGARDRAVAALQAARADPPAEETTSATVPSVYRVPRDLASEAAAARAAPQTAVAADEDTAEPEVAETEVPEEAPAEIAANEATEDAAEPEVAETEAPEEAPAEVAADEATEDAAEPEVAETEAPEEAPAEVAADEATEDAAEPEVAETEAPEEAPAEMAADEATEDDTLALLASADIGNGESVWRQCRACHVHDAEQNRGGPHLVGIIGREVGVAEGWRYSNALANHGGVWTVESLLSWLENPDSYIPGNQMAFRGLRNEQDRIDLLGFLNASSTD